MNRLILRIVFAFGITSSAFGESPPQAISFGSGAAGDFDNDGDRFWPLWAEGSGRPHRTANGSVSARQVDVLWFEQLTTPGDLRADGDFSVNRTGHRDDKYQCTG